MSREAKTIAPNPSASTSSAKSKGKVEETLSRPGDKFGPHVVNTMMESELTNLLAKAHAPQEYEARVATREETPESVPQGWICLYTAYISKAGLRFPIPDLLIEVLDRYQLASCQLNPSAVKSVIALLVRSREENIHVTVDDFVDLFLIKEAPCNRGSKGVYYCPARPMRTFYKSDGSGDDRWKSKFFFLKIAPGSIHPSTNYAVFGTRPLVSQDLDPF